MRARFIPDPAAGTARRDVAVLPLLVVFAAGAVLCGVFALQVTQWTVMVDELLYRKIAEGMARSLSPLPEVHGDSAAYPTILYPLLMAPIFGLIEPVTAFRVAHAVNAVVMASAAVPAYLLARRLVASRVVPLLVALLTVLVPWIAFSTVILTEVVGYPAFLWALLAAQRALAEPSPRRDAVAVAAVVLATTARPQFLVLGPALAVAAALHAVGGGLATPRDGGRLRAVGRRLVDAARGHRLGIAVAAVGLLAFPLLQPLLGNYAGELDAQLLPAGTFAHAVDLLAVIAVGAGLVPLVVGLAWALSTLVRPASKEAHAFAVLAFVTVPAVVVVAASFNLRNGAGILYDRYAFYIAPVMLLAMGAGLANARRMLVALPVAAAAAAAAVLAYDFRAYELPWFVSPASVFHQVLDGRAYQLGSWVGVADLDPGIVLAAVAVAAAAVVAVCARRRPSPAVVLGTPLAVFLLVQAVYVLGHLGIEAQPASLHRDQSWVDEAVDDTLVASVPGAIAQEGTGSAPYWNLEFWNTSVRRQLSYENAQAHHTELGSGQLTVDPANGALTLSEPVRHLVLPAEDRRFRPAGRSLARHDGLELIAVGPRPRAAWVIRGTDSEGGWVPAGGEAIVDVYGEGGQRVLLTVVPPPEQARARRVVVEGGVREVAASIAPGRRQEVAVPICLGGEPRGRLTVRFDGATRLPSGQRVGGAILTARTAQAAACDAR